MKLTARLMLYLVVPLVGVLAVDGYLSVRRQIALFEEDQEDNARRLGHAMREMITSVWRSKGPEPAFQLIRDADEEDRRMRIRWVWLDAVGDAQRPLADPADLGPVLRGKEQSIKGRDATGSGFRHTYIPVFVEGERKGALELSESLSRLDEYARATVARVLALTAVLVLAGAVATLLLGVRLFGRPLGLLIDKTRRVGSGDLSAPLHLHGRSELTELADAMNLMCERLADAQESVRVETDARIVALEQLRHADRLTTVGRLASGMAHELGTPLNVVAGRASFIASGKLSESETRKSAEIIRSQSERMTAIIRKLLDFARRGSPRRSLVDLRKLVQRSLELTASLGHKAHAVLAAEGAAGPLMARVDPGQIQQVLTNLIVNAFQAMPEGGRVEVRIRAVRARPPEVPAGPEADYLCVQFEDEGEGIPSEARSRLFDPFFTTKDVGEGTGLGLSVSNGIVERHGGRLEVESQVGKGSAFTVVLPVKMQMDGEGK
jgi:signal transduction histidine kinase